MVVQRSEILLRLVSLIRRSQKFGIHFSIGDYKEKAFDVTIRKAKRDFIDKVRILVRGGSGGMGYYTTGGIGGNGGQVVFESKKGASLSQFGVQHSKRITGAHGQNCRKTRVSGEHGVAKKFYLPPGTIVSCTEDGVLADLAKVGQRVVVAKGGLGGRHFNKFNGQRGEKRIISLELKSIADIGLVGYPNAGKSTLLSNISKAKPRIGHYPFTTTRPTIGSVFYDNKKQLTIADLPGLIENAHKNKGMGHRFLRHVERTKGLLMLIDVNGFQLKQDLPVRSPLETLCLLFKELYLYENSLLELPTVVAINKVDKDSCKQRYQLAKDSIMNATKDSVAEIVTDPQVSLAVHRKLCEICENDEKSIIRTSTKFGIGLSQVRDTLYDITFLASDNDANQEFDEDIGDDDDDDDLAEERHLT